MEPTTRFPHFDPKDKESGT